jgi:hypothetical protein
MLRKPGLSVQYIRFGSGADDQANHCRRVKSRLLLLPRNDHHSDWPDGLPAVPREPRDASRERGPELRSARCDPKGPVRSQSCPRQTCRRTLAAEAELLGPCKKGTTASRVIHGPRSEVAASSVRHSGTRTAWPPTFRGSGFRRPPLCHRARPRSLGKGPSAIIRRHDAKEVVRDGKFSHQVSKPGNRHGTGRQDQLDFIHISAMRLTAKDPTTVGRWSRRPVQPASAFRRWHPD